MSPILTFTATIRRVLPCAECGTELKEYSFEFEHNLDDELPSGDAKCQYPDAEDGAHAFEMVGADASNTERMETTDRKDRKIRNSRYMTHYYGAQLDVLVKCTHCSHTLVFTLDDEASALQADCGEDYEAWRRYEDQEGGVMTIRVLLVLVGEGGEGGEVKAVYADTDDGRETAAARVLYEQLRMGDAKWAEIPKREMGLDRIEVVKVWCRAGRRAFFESNVDAQCCDLVWIELHRVQEVDQTIAEKASVSP